MSPDGEGITRVGMWSGPRNISTAMMRSWENRPDTVVVDEPFYAAYLHRTGLDHPGREETLASQPVDPSVIVRQLRALPDSGATVAYAKHMSHHMLPTDDVSWTLDFHNVLLLRDPGEVVASYTRSRQSCEPADIGVPQQVRLWQEWQAAGTEVPVIDAADFLRDPESYLRWLCAWLGIDFAPQMLRWPSGPRDTDGVWGGHWYQAVRASTGFGRYAPREVRLEGHHAWVAESCRPLYEMLREHRLLL